MQVIQDSENPFMRADWGLDSPVPGESIVAVLQTIVVTLAFLVVMYLFVFTPSEVSGPSMRETLQHQDFLIVNKLVQIFGGPRSPVVSIFGDYQRGDIVTFVNTISGVKEDLVKRVIGIPGDRVMVKDKKVYVNDKLVDEFYLADGTYYNPNPTFHGDERNNTLFNKDNTNITGTWLTNGEVKIVPADSYFLLGDNRGNSTDSRSDLVKFVNRSQMHGKVVFRILPFNTMGIVK